MNGNRFAFAYRYFYYYAVGNSDLCCREMPGQD